MQITDESREVGARKFSRPFKKGSETFTAIKEVGWKVSPDIFHLTLVGTK